MPNRSRSLTMADVGRLVALSRQSADRPAFYAAVQAIAGETCGFVLLTTLRYDEAKGVVVRLHSSDPKSYPVGGTKPLDQLTENQRIMDRGDVALAANPDAIRRLFFDHELILSLGITAILNAPVRYGNRRLGTLNFCGLADTYGPEQVEAAQILAGLLVPALLH
jgi:GAF domain-containing protein